MKKYLKVNLNGSKEGIAPEIVSDNIKREYPFTVSSVEICNDPEQTVPMVRKGILNIKDLPDNFKISDLGMSFSNGDYVDLNHYPELEPLCTDIIDWSQVKKGDLVEVKSDHDIVAHGIFNGCENSKLSFGMYWWDESRIKSIRIIERAKNV